MSALLALLVLLQRSSSWSPVNGPSRRGVVALPPAVGRDLARATIISTLSLVSFAPATYASTLAEQLTAMQAAQQALDAQDVEWTPVGTGGVSFREYRAGRTGAAAVVDKGKTVTVELVGRIKTLRTQDNPGGVRYYSTKEDTPNNELSWEVGSGVMIPGLEEGMMGMAPGALRRVEVPSLQVFKARKDENLPKPSEKDDEGQRRFARLFKSDATLLFEVLVKRID